MILPSRNLPSTGGWWVRFSRHATFVHVLFRCRIFLHHACVFQHVRPLPARSCVAVLKMLSEVIRPEELLAAVALPKLVIRHEVLRALVPVLVRRRATDTASGHGTGAVEIPTAVATGVGFARPVCAFMERLAVVRKRFTAPTVPSHVETVLVPLCLVLVLEAIATKRTLVLFLCRVRTRGGFR